MGCIKRVAVGIVFLALLLSTIASLSFANTVQPSGSGAGGGSSTQGIGGGASNTIGADSIVNVKNYGAKGDGKIKYDGSMTTGQTTYSIGTSGEPAIAIFRGVNNVTPVDPGGSAHAHQQGSSTTVTAPSVTTTVNNDLVITSMMAYNAGAGTTFTVPTTPTQATLFTAPTGGASPFFHNYIGYQVVAAAGVVPAVSTPVEGVTYSFNGITIALQPANAAVAPTFVGALSAVSTTANTGSFPVSGSSFFWGPNGIQVGDVGVVCLSDNNSGTVTTAPSGPSGGTWTLVDNVTNGTTATFGSHCYTHVYADATGMTLTSAANTFVAGDVGKLVCVAGAGNKVVNPPSRNSVVGATTFGSEACGTIQSLTDANDVVLSVSNQNPAIGSAALTLTAATDDSSGLITFTNSGTNVNVLSEGQVVTIAGVTPAGYNGNYTVFAIGNSTTFYVHGTPSLGAGSVFGTATPRFEYRYATNDDTAFTSAINALAALPGGGELFMPAGLYGKTTGITLPANIGVGYIMQGAGSGLPEWFWSNLVEGGIPGTALMFLTTSMGSTAGITTGLTSVAELNPDGLLLQLSRKSLRDFSILGGAGVSYLGGGTTAPGVLVNGETIFSMDHVDIENFGGNCVTEQATGGVAATDYMSGQSIRNSWFHNCGGIGAALWGEVTMFANNEVDMMQKNGVDISGVNGGGVIENNNLQWNNQSATNPGYELFGGSSPIAGCIIEGNWFEEALAGLHTSPFNTTAQFSGCAFVANHSTNTLTPVVYSAAGVAIPSCSGNAAQLSNGAPQCVSDAINCNNGQTYSSGGGTSCQVVCNGTNWIENGIGCGGGPANNGLINGCSGFITLASGIGNTVVAKNTNTATGANLAGACISKFANIACVQIANNNVGLAPATPANTPAVFNCFASPTATATAGMAATATATAIFGVASTANSTATLLWWGQN